MNVIEVKNLGKKYIITHENQGGHKYTALRDVLTDGAKNLWKRAVGSLYKKSGDNSNPKKEEFWALKNISFNIKQGERIGIIGRNGAGKTTLLKILSRITEPTEGFARIKGRVSSLLEVGTGFHPELTGRENIYLNGAVLGMKKTEIKKKFDEIVSFSGVERFLDTPVKRFSSGMQVRLAFAVAAHLEPEILLVDEVLAVGDAEFQKKCLGKMDEVSKEYGRTVMFVSHNMPMISSLCNRCILLNDGKVQATGKPGEVIATYQYGGQNTPGFVDYENAIKKPGDNLGILLSGWIEDKYGERSLDILINQPFRICMRYRVLKDVPKMPYPNFHLFDSQGQYVFAISPSDINNNGPFKEGEYFASCEVPANFLNDGLFSVGLALTFIHSGIHVSFYEKHALTFNITDPIDGVSTRASGYSGRIPGVVRPKLKWTIRRE